MPSYSPRLGLERPLLADPFDPQDYADNLTLLDGFPGLFITTSGARPAGWGVAHTGMRIFETDTGLAWWWNGSAWRRVAPQGLLAVAEIAADFPTSSTAAVAAITAASVAIPSTHVGSTTKRIKITGTWYNLDNGTSTTLGACEVSIWRGTTAIVTQLKRGRPNTATSPLDWSTGDSITAFDDPPAGATTYTLRINSLSSIGGTTTLRASPTTKAQLAVEEVGL